MVFSLIVLPLFVPVPAKIVQRFQQEKLKRLIYVFKTHLSKRKNWQINKKTKLLSKGEGLNKKIRYQKLVIL